MKTLIDSLVKVARFELKQLNAVVLSGEPASRVERQIGRYTLAVEMAQKIPQEYFPKDEEGRQAVASRVSKAIDAMEEEEMIHASK